jgi:hypothetical protein
MTPEEYWHRRAADWPTAEQNARGLPKRKLSKKEREKRDRAVKDILKAELRQIAKNKRRKAQNN